MSSSSTSSQSDPREPYSPDRVWQHDHVESISNVFEGRGSIPLTWSSSSSLLISGHQTAIRLPWAYVADRDLQHDGDELISTVFEDIMLPSTWSFIYADYYQAFRDEATMNSANAFDSKRSLRKKVEVLIAQANMNLWRLIVIGNPGGKNRQNAISPAVYKNENKHFWSRKNSSTILIKLKEIAETCFGTSVEDDVVIIVPAYFNRVQRQAIKEAGAIAGLNFVYIINESTDSAVAYCTHKELTSNKNLGTRHILVSVLVVRHLMLLLCVVIQKGKFEVKVVISRNTRLRGCDSDWTVVDYFRAIFERKLK